MKESLYRIILKGTKKTLKERKISVSEKNEKAIKKSDLENSVKDTKMYDENYQWTYMIPKFEKNISVKMRTQVHFMDNDFIDVALWLQKSKQVNPLVVVPSSFSFDCVVSGDESNLEKTLWCRTSTPLIFQKNNPYFSLPSDSKRSVLYTPNVLVFRDDESSGNLFFYYFYFLFFSIFFFLFIFIIFCLFFFYFILFLFILIFFIFSLLFLFHFYFFTKNQKKKGFSYFSPPSKVSFLHVSPIQSPKMVTNKNKGTVAFSKKDKNLLNERISLALQVGLENGHDAIVFTAIGCGRSFNSSSLLVARLMRSVLSLYRQKYSHIIFAIRDSDDTNNLKTFQKVFQTPVKKRRPKRN